MHNLFFIVTIVLYHIFFVLSTIFCKILKNLAPNNHEILLFQVLAYFYMLVFLFWFRLVSYLKYRLCFILLLRYYYKKIVLSTKKHNFLKNFCKKIKNDHFKPFFNKNSYILATLFNTYNYTKNAKNDVITPFLISCKKFILFGFNFICLSFQYYLILTNKCHCLTYLVRISNRRTIDSRYYQYNTILFLR